MIRELYSTATFPDKFHSIAMRLVRGGEIIGLIMFQYFANINTGYISFVGTVVHVRGRNIGSAMLEKVKQVLDDNSIKAGNKSCAGIFAEYDLFNKDIPRTIASCRFWHRHQLHPLNIKWVNPNYEKECYLAFMDMARNSIHFTSEEIEETAKTIYAKSCNNNQIIKSILDEIKNNDDIRAVPLNLSN